MALDILNNINIFQGGSISPYVGGSQGNWFYIDYNSIILNADESLEVTSFYITRVLDFEVEFLNNGNWIPFSAITKKIIIVPNLSGVSSSYFYSTVMRVKAPYVYYGDLPFFYLRALTNKNSPSSNYWSIKELLVYCNIAYTNTSPILNFVNTLETFRPNKFYISYDLILENSDGFDLETVPVFIVKNIHNGVCLKGGLPVSAPFYIEPNEFITWQYNTSQDEIVNAFSVVLNDLNADSQEIDIKIHCKTSNDLDIDIEFYLSLFGKNLNSNNVKCFKCGFPLRLNQTNLKCDNLHIYDFKDYIYEHSSYLSSLIDTVKDDKICNK